MEVRHATAPDQIRHFDTAELRKRYLVEGLFGPEVDGVYTHQDRMVVAGVKPVTRSRLAAFDPLRSRYFLERRELGVINIGDPGVVTVDGTPYEMDRKDCLYVGMGTEDVTFEGGTFYLVSAPAHERHPTTHARLKDVEPVRLGAQEGSNDRTIYKYVHLDGIHSCQLVMGVTVLEPGSMWNTMPCHTHDRRTEVYLYFDLPPQERVIHLMGRPDETRNLVVANEQAVISPSWSVHCGFGTRSYAFVWAMAGENQAFDDMDQVSIGEMR
ncbi:5-dehydro-4-deoxy-D-glucuronate isomerase [Nonomuraea sediminis]|uniref:5-dehydro-4-deoxy-D-glucuronate isomerase n=1 Tax=Nonomuraea sediminis TaxID=2835864 RepID=UPI001BDCF09A|nr:5-dehydro-4-deoxy-D-glucuronate isomerase [Nonomuraea sediminis]